MSHFRQRKLQPIADLDTDVYLRIIKTRAFNLLGVSHTHLLSPHRYIHQVSPSSPSRDTVVVCQCGSHRFLLCSFSFTSLEHHHQPGQGHWASPNICLHTSPPPGSFPTSSVSHPDTIFAIFFLAPSPRFWFQSAS